MMTIVSASTVPINWFEWKLHHITQTRLLINIIQYGIPYGHYYLILSYLLGVRVMVFNATFNNISVISWRSVLLVEETEVPGEIHRPATSHRQTYYIMLYRVHLA
jgi:hypothetical protein